MACENCGQSFRLAEDYRDHLPCETKDQKAMRLLKEENEKLKARLAKIHGAAMLLEAALEAPTEMTRTMVVAAQGFVRVVLKYAKGDS